ncbi:FmdE family protein [Dehalobacter sp. DCM]|uniref:FmdE family protein n=1 Tax=Dehalobacter sp. DCM TaxID=2907827 RepID=UPI0030819BED|nr:FmdE family protein [Dehalobacter sp. DCM]
MRTFKEDLEAASAYHGHLCAGMFIGVRMARFGSKLLGIEDPLTFKDLIVYVEIDRCASDAICVVTGCTLGRKRLKLVNYGKMAATFLNLQTNEAVRLSSAANIQMPDDADPYQFWEGFDDRDLFKVEKVTVDILPRDLPGKPLRSIQCSQCGEKVMDARDVEKDGMTLCLSCAEEAYYRKL